MSLETELHLDRPFADMRHEAVISIVQTANLLSARVSSLFRSFSLTEAQFNVLLALKRKTRPITQSDLGKRLVVTRASITSVLDKLEAKRLVERRNVPGNRRINHVELTPQGDALIEQMDPQYRHAVHAAMELLSDPECRTLIKQLERIRNSLRKSSANLAETE